MQKVFCKSLAVAAIAISSVWCRAAAPDSVVARYHFVGTSQLTAKNYDSTRKLLNQPSSVEYRNLVLNRLSGQIAASILGKNSPSSVRPLLDDLLANESTGAFGIPGQGQQSFVVAVHLPTDRAALWQHSLGNAVRIHHEGDWLIVSRGSGLQSAEETFAGEIRRNHRPVPALKDTILEANVDWPRLNNLPALAAFPFKPAALQIKVAPKGDHLRTEIHAHYPQPIAWKSMHWQLPTETIRDPLVSFSAGQNIAAFMKPSRLAERIGENPFTNEFFLWANLNVPFETSALFPMKNAPRHLQSLGRELPSKFNAELEKNYEGQLKYLEKTNELVWQGLPIIVPYVKSVHEKAGEFLLAGTFVLAPGGPPAPSDLWSQFKGRNDLVYYDWEISGPRMAQWRMLTPLLPIFPMPRTNDLAWTYKNSNASHSAPAIVDHWLSGLIPGLSPSKQNPSNGNVATEITRNSASDYTVVRSSQLGFTSIELMMLSHWLAGTQPPEAQRPGAPFPQAPAATHKTK